MIRFLPDANRPETISGQSVKQVSSAGNILLKWSGHDLWNDTPQQALRYQWRLGRLPPHLKRAASGEDAIKPTRTDSETIGDTEHPPVETPSLRPPSAWPTDIIVILTILCALLVYFQYTTLEKFSTISPAVRNYLTRDFIEHIVGTLPLRNECRIISTNCNESLARCIRIS